MQSPCFEYNFQFRGHPSCVYRLFIRSLAAPAVSLGTGERTAEYFLFNDDSTPFTGHVGGVAVTESRFYLSAKLDSGGVAVHPRRASLGRRNFLQKHFCQIEPSKSINVWLSFGRIHCFANIFAVGYEARDSISLAWA